jgi:hypothetical protein
VRTSSRILGVYDASEMPTPFVSTAWEVQRFDAASHSPSYANRPHRQTKPPRRKPRLAPIPSVRGASHWRRGRDRADVPPNYRSPNRDRALGRILGFAEFGSATCDKRGIGVPGDFVQPARRYWRFVVAYGRVFTRPHFPPRKGFGACRSALDRRWIDVSPLASRCSASWR